MMGRVAPAKWLVIALCTLASGTGCGSDGGGGNMRASPTPASTPTSAPTAPTTTTPTPAPAATVAVTFTVTAASPLQAFQFRALTPTSKGSFSGSADQVQCATAAAGIFTKNDRDGGTLVLSLASDTELGFPTDIGCVFEVTAGPLTADDIEIIVEEVTAEGAEGAASALGVSVNVSADVSGR